MRVGLYSCDYETLTVSGVFRFRNVAQSVSSDGVSTKNSGLTPTVVAVINDVLVPIRRMRLTKVEYVLLQAIIFFDPGEYLTSNFGSDKSTIYVRCFFDSL